jgi:Glycosyltransferase family 87
VAVIGIVSSLALTLVACLGKDWLCHFSPRGARIAYVGAALILQAICVSRAAAGQVWESLLAGTGAALVIAAACSPRFKGSMTSALVGGTALVLAGVGLLEIHFAFAERSVFVTAARLAAAAGVCVVVAGMINQELACKRTWRRLLLAAVVAGGLLRVSALWASPEPVIDVYGWLQEAPGHLLHGLSPYAAAYSNCYATDLAKETHMYHARSDPHPAAYPPLPILIALPFRAAGWDVRGANVCCDIAAALVLFAAARRRGQPFIGFCIAAIYLNLPGVPYLTEQAWYEPMIAALIGGGLLRAENGGWFGNVLVGLGVTGKQFGLPLLFPLLRGQRSRWRSALLVTGGAGLAVILPFLLWDPRSFTEVVIMKHLQRPANFDLNTIFGLAYHLFGWQLSRYFAWSIAAAAIGYVSWRTPEKGTGTGLWLGTALLAFLFCNPVAYFNYFYLAEYLLLLGAAGLVTAESVSAGIQAPEDTARVFNAETQAMPDRAEVA